MCQVFSVNVAAVKVIDMSSCPAYLPSYLETVLTFPSILAAARWLLAIVLMVIILTALIPKVKYIKE